MVQVVLDRVASNRCLASGGGDDHGGPEYLKRIRPPPLRDDAIRGCLVTGVNPGRGGPEIRPSRGHRELRSRAGQAFLPLRR